LTINPVFTDAKPLAAPDARRQFADDVVAGLSAPRKFLSAKYFYDAAGSDLFEGITRLPEYYPTRTELGILDAKGAEIAALLPERASLVEFGSGSTVKVRRLLVHRPDLRAYVPVDVSETFLHSEARVLAADFPNLTIVPVAADFTRAFTLPDDVSRDAVAGFFPGSTIGNFEPPQATDLLAHFGRVLGSGATLIIGVDLVKDKAILDAAYDDAAGVTAAFNRNLLVRMERELGASLDVEGFSHRAFFNVDASRIEMHLVSRRAQTIRLGEQSFAFAEGESIHTENSYKYTREGFRALASAAGWTSLAVWTDPENLFSVHALTRP
jgi:dimethylhistidine N-methyltransferase